MLIHLLFFVPDSGQILSCTLWGDYCLQFLAYLDVVENNGPVVILLTYARIKEVEGKFDVKFFDCHPHKIMIVSFLLTPVQDHTHPQ